MNHEKIIYSDAANYQQDVLASKLPVLLDFWSEECPPCEALAPMFELLADKYGDKLRFVKIQRESNRELAESLNVFGSPTLIFFSDGQEIAGRLNGFIKKPDLRKAIEAVLGIEEENIKKPTVYCDLVILGGGPAGLTAGLYASRAKLNTVLLDEGLPGGQVSNTYHIANFPGTGGVVRGRELMESILEQAKSFGLEVEYFKEIFSVSLEGEEKEIITEDTIYKPKAVIIATGARPRKLPAAGAEEWQGHGVHYCATCDAAMYEGMHVLVLGGGNSAVEEALYLARFAGKVTIIHEFADLQAGKIAQEEAFNNPKIDFVWECHARRVEAGDGHFGGVVVEHLPSGEEKLVKGDGIFVYIGTEPETKLFAGQLETNPDGYIVADAEMRTKLPGVFAAGDVRRKEVRQAVVAAGEGAVAAVQAEKYLAKLG